MGGQEMLDGLEREIDQCSVQAHMAMAGLAKAAASFEEEGGWAWPGFRTFEHWLAVEMGFDQHTGRELVRVGKSLRDLPLIAAEFAAGRLSFDKVREVTTVATAETDALMVEIALGSSASQLTRICRSLRKMTAPESHQHQVQRGLWMRFEDNGMMRLVANLPAEEAAVVQAAIDSLAEKMPLPDEADDPHAARRLDAMVSTLDGATGGRQLVVHVDVGVLAGDTVEAQIARRLGCDAEIVPLIERDGIPVDVGRKHRTAPPKLRMALEARDRFCRFPGCNVPADKTDAHHLNQWIFGGATNLAEMLLLCRYHHRIYHEGGYRIVKSGDGFRFETNDGHVFGAPREIAAQEITVTDATAARAEWGGERMDLHHTMFVLGQYFGPAETRAGPS
ncbi:MAG TPA: DUF222 domain-containing protein [Candidatus Dormibacteraeota bacterium]|nr:DUF222 domain-containing protein [Candidatus Dormibacteraeota bacterium]